MGKRRKARELVLQSLYAETMSRDPAETIIGQLMKPLENDQEVHAFAEQLFRQCIRFAEALDLDVASMLKNWEFNRVALIDRLILRLALCELLYFQEIPPKVTINEAIDLAKKYSTGESGRFVNGILDALFKKCSDEKRIKKSGRGLL
ncbi:transcription antitermination factor NusB [bacterium]|nr:transcription antitermination factor NusB [bacterium]